MKRDNDRQASIVLAVIGIPLVIWLALLIAPSVKGGLPEILPKLLTVFNDPFHIEVCDDSLKTVLVLLLAYAMGIGIYFSTPVSYTHLSADSFDKDYPEAARTYAVSSNNKAFMPNMGGYSIYGSSLDGSDRNVRLERYMAKEHGGKDGWKIERCYMKDDSKKQMLDVIAGKFFICYAPVSYTHLDVYKRQSHSSFIRNPLSPPVVLRKLMYPRCV